ncbi:MAG TPA: hypothetical protein VKZ49_18640 [Polyangiaceae bacterium]|nr:hypothetical protein [Polyangiaceae bacterium]
MMARKLGWLAVVAGCAVSLGCGGDQKEADAPGQGPMEEAGEEVDEAADTAAEGAEDAVDETGEAVEEAGEDMQDATE